MTTNYYTSGSTTEPAYENIVSLCNTPLPPITTVTEKLYFSSPNIGKIGVETDEGQSMMNNVSDNTMSLLDFNSRSENLVDKICQADLMIAKGYGEVPIEDLSQMDTANFLIYQNNEKFNFASINHEFQAGGVDFYMSSYGDNQTQHHQLPHLLPQMELIPSASHELRPCVQHSWSSQIQQQLMQDEAEESEDDSEQIQQQLLLQQQALQLNQLLSQQHDQQNQQIQPQPIQVQGDLQQFHNLDNSRQMPQLHQHFQQESQQLPQQPQHLQQLYQDQDLNYGSSNRSDGSVGDGVDILSNEAYCADALANYLLKTEFSTSACLTSSVSSTTQTNFSQQTVAASQQCCSTTTFDLLETIRMESKGLKFADGKTSLAESSHMSPSHDLPSSTTDGCTASTIPKIGSSEGYNSSKIRVITDKEELNTRDIASRVNAELKKYSIPQAIFAERVLGRSQGTLSDLLRNPKPWSKLKSGRETFRRMRRWLDEPEHSRMVQLRVISGDSTDCGSARPTNPAEGSPFVLLVAR